MSDSIPLGRPTVGDEEIAAVAAVFDSGWLAGAGPACKRFEQQLAELTGTGTALATSNCGNALHLALVVLGAQPGDEIIVADYTFPATGHAVLTVGATPVFADVRPDHWGIDPAAVEAAVTPKTTGIIAVDVFGQPADWDELRAIADKHGLFLVADAACSIGATYKGRPVGSFGDIAAFSFHGRKIVTAGEGGALTSTNTELIERARKLHTYGIEPAFSREGSSTLPVPSFAELGWNYRMSEVQAAIMEVQLNRLPHILATRRQVADRYGELMKDIDGITLPVALPDREHPWQAYALTIEPEISRDEVAMRLRARGVQCNFGTYASHLQPINGAAEPCPVSADLFRRQLAIPMHAELTDDQVERVAEAVREVVAELS